jgi:hypothetical protein
MVKVCDNNHTIHHNCWDSIGVFSNSTACPM